MPVHDPAAFDALVQAQLPRLFKLARHITGSADVAEDVVQTVFMKLWLRQEALDPDTDLHWYLWTATRNEARQHLRKAGVRERYVEQQRPVMESVSAVGNTGADAIEADETVAKVLRLLETLPPRCREIFLLYWRDECTPEEIAAVYEISIRTVQNQIARAVKMLSAELRLHD